MFKRVFQSPILFVDDLEVRIKALSCGLDDFSDIFLDGVYLYGMSFGALFFQGFNLITLEFFVLHKNDVFVAFKRLYDKVSAFF